MNPKLCPEVTRVIRLFHEAMELDDPDSDELSEGAIDASNRAFDAAMEFGCNLEKQGDFGEWCLHATYHEILTMGLSKFCAWVLFGDEP